MSRNQTKILDAIAADPRITINSLSEKVCIGTTAVENNLKKLKTKGAIAGAWLSRFHGACRQPGFSRSDYLAKLAGGDEKKN